MQPGVERGRKREREKEREIGNSERSETDRKKRGGHTDLSLKS